MVIKNNGDKDVKLVKADNPATRVTELHTHLNEGGVMKMRQVPLIAVPAKGEAALKPGSYHVMLIDLNKLLAKGEIVPITLKVEGKDKKVEAVEVKAEVRELTAPAPMEHRH